MTCSSRPKAFTAAGFFLGFGVFIMFSAHYVTCQNNSQGQRTGSAALRMAGSSLYSPPNGLDVFVSTRQSVCMLLNGRDIPVAAALPSFKLRRLT